MRRKRVILAVCVVLVLTCSGLLLSAVQRTREAAARTTCQGKLKYLSCAVHWCSDANEPITGTIPLPGIPPDRRLSWLVVILRCAEQQQVYEQFDRSLPADAERNRTAADHSLRAFICPSSTGPWSTSAGPVTHYVGVAGVGTDAAELAEGHPRAGAFGYDRKTRVSRDGYPDGLANSLLLVETAHDTTSWARGGPGTVRPFVPDTVPYVGPDRPFGGIHVGRGLWRGPPGGLMNVAMADTSIRTIRGDIEPAVLEALATVNGREALPADW